MIHIYYGSPRNLTLHTSRHSNQKVLRTFKFCSTPTTDPQSTTIYTSGRFPSRSHLNSTFSTSNHGTLFDHDRRCSSNQELVFNPYGPVRKNLTIYHFCELSQNTQNVIVDKTQTRVSNCTRHFFSCLYLDLSTLLCI